MRNVNSSCLWNVMIGRYQNPSWRGAHHQKRAMIQVSIAAYLLRIQLELHLAMNK